jgi:hypothetical protein
MKKETKIDEKIEKYIEMLETVRKYEEHIKQEKKIKNPKKNKFNRQQI